MESLLALQEAALLVVIAVVSNPRNMASIMPGLMTADGAGFCQVPSGPRPLIVESQWDRSWQLCGLGIEMQIDVNFGWSSAISYCLMDPASFRQVSHKNNGTRGNSKP